MQFIQERILSQQGEAFPMQPKPFLNQEEAIQSAIGLTASPNFKNVQGNPQRLLRQADPSRVEGKFPSQVRLDVILMDLLRRLAERGR